VTELAVYDTHEEIFQRKSSLAELTADVSAFSQQSVLWVCASIVTGLQLWDSIDAEPQVYAQFLSLFFARDLRLRLIAGYWGSPRRVLFHRRQVLLIAKLAILHCSGAGLDARRNAARFGPLLLKANDQFDHGLLPRTAAKLKTREGFSKLVTEMVAVEESSSPTVAHLMTRNHLMLARFAEEMRGDPRFVDIAGEYREETGISLTELEAMAFSVHARFGRELVQQAYKNPGVIPLKEVNFSATAITYDKVRRFIDSVSSNPSLMADELCTKDEGPNDVTIFRKYPLVLQYYNMHLTSAWVGFLMMDNRFLLDKALTGPYWHASRAHGSRLRAFWGSVFERYVNELMTRACSGTSSTFFPDPRPADNQAVQICDGIVVSGDSIALIEYKSSMFRADSKYHGDHIALAREIENKLVHDTEADEKKGVEQLSEAVKMLFGREANVTLPGIDLSRIRRVYPYMVTLDSIGGVVGMSAFLNTYFADRMKGAPVSVEVRPLFCSNVAELEDKSGYFGSRTLPQILEMWYAANPALIAPLGLVHIAAHEWRGNEWLAAEWDAIFKETTAILYPGIDPGPGMAESIRRRRAAAGQ
jgi:hypothetical protein